MGIKCLILSVILFAATSVQAVLIDGVNTVIIDGHSDDYSYGFTAQVDYWVYDGADATDPLGPNGEIQIAFKLTHLGASGYAVNTVSFGRFSVFSDADGTTVGEAWLPFYGDIDAAGSGVAPSSIDGGGVNDGMFIRSPSTGSANNYAEFLFESTDWLYTPQVDENELTQILVVSLADSDSITSEFDIQIQIDRTNSISAADGDAFITIVPEPATIAVLGFGFGLISFKRKRK